MGYRDDLHAAHARLEVLERDLAASRADDAADARRIAALEAELAGVRAGIAEIERDAAGRSARSALLWWARRRWRWIVAALALAALAIWSTRCILEFRRNSCPLLQASGKTDPDTHARLCACNDPSLWSCYIAGSAYEHGREVEPDLERALGLYRRACEHAVGEYDRLYGGDACFALARLDEPGAVGWLERGCAVKHAESCNALGERIAASDVERARRLFSQACDAKEWSACRNLALSWGDDAANSRPAFERACELRDVFACDAVGGILEATDPTAAARRYQDACDRRYAPACAHLARLYRDGRGVAKNDTLADELVRRACVEGDRASCP